MARASDPVVHYFKGNTDRFESEGRSVSVSETRTHSISIVGKYNDLRAMNLKVGDPVPSFVDQGTVSYGTLYIRDYNIARDAGDMARMTINCVEAANRSSPYNVTVDIDLAQVEKRLVNHPLLNTTTTQFQIKLWEKTEDNMQFDSSGNPQSMYRLVDEGSGQSAKKAGEPLTAPIKLTDEYAIRYAKMRLIGVENYSIYLPIVTRTSQYLALPGVNINPSNMSASGTANPPDINKIGRFDTPPINVAGFQGGLWFKNGDKFTQNANGSWTRTESWTYTNDLRTQWIYADGVSYEIVRGDTNGKKK